jgi:glutaredoxin-like YruB-family protein
VPIFSIVLICLGLLLLVVGGLMQIVAAFRESVVWGLVVIFAPAGNLIHACCHWAEAKAGFLTNLAGGMILVVGFIALPEIREKIADGALWKEDTEQVADLSTQIADKRKEIEELQGAFATFARDLPAEFAQLEKRRASLKADDQDAIAKFNADAAAYQAKNKRHKEIQKDLTTSQAELDQLLEKRSRDKTRSTNRGGGGGKPVVMYTTSHCPACKAAKQYMAQKGIQYQEIDVENSRDGMEAFQRLGGHGVPLIMVGDKRMDGFSPQKLDQMLL